MARVSKKVEEQINELVDNYEVERVVEDPYQETTKDEIVEADFDEKIGQKTKIAEEEADESLEALLASAVVFADEEDAPVRPLDQWYGLGYQEIRLNEMEVGESYIGNPVLTIIEKGKKFVEADGSEKQSIYAYLVLVDDEAREYLTIGLNLKEYDDVQKNVHPKSKLYTLVSELMRLVTGKETPRRTMETVTLSTIRNILKKITSMEIEVIEVPARDINPYKNFKINNIE